MALKIRNAWRFAWQGIFAITGRIDGFQFIPAETGRGLA